METYSCKRYRRAAPGQARGVLTDTLTCTARDAAEAARFVARSLQPGGIARMDWDRDFATLENEAGTALTIWLDGVPRV